MEKLNRIIKIQQDTKSLTRKIRHNMTSLFIFLLIGSMLLFYVYFKMFNDLENRINKSSDEITRSSDEITRRIDQEMNIKIPNMEENR